MKRKLFSTILFGALLTASTSGLTSCKDYDDDISNLQSQIDKLATADQLSAKVTELQGQIAQAKSDAIDAANSAKQVADAALKAAQDAATKGDVEAAKAAADAAQKTVDDLKASGVSAAAINAAQEAADKANAAIAEAIEKGTPVIEGLNKAIEDLKAAEEEHTKAINDLDKQLNGEGGIAERLAAAEKAIEEGANIDLTELTKLIDEFEAKAKEILGTAFVMVTDVDLYVTAWSNEYDGDTDLEFYKVKELDNITWPGTEATGDSKFTFTKDNVRLFDDQLVVRVSPIDATLTPEMISLINSQGAEVSKDLVEITSVEPYEGLLTTTRGTSNNGLWTVNFKVADNKQDELNSVAKVNAGKSNEKSILFAVAVNNTQDVADTRRVISAYDVTMEAKDAKPTDMKSLYVGGYDANVNAIGKIHNRYSKSENNTPVTIKDYIWKNKPELTVTDNNKKDGDNRDNEKVLPVNLGQVIPIWFNSDPIRGFYVTLDSERAVESGVSEINAWNSYSYENVGKTGVAATLQEGNLGYITINDLANMNLVGDIIGFRVYAINLDGTLVDPDGIAFYVGIKAQTAEGVDLGSSDIVVTETAGNKANLSKVFSLEEAYKDVDFDNIDWSYKSGKPDGAVTPASGDIKVIYKPADVTKADVAVKDAKNMFIQIANPGQFVDDTEYTFKGEMKKGIGGASYTVRTITVKFTKKLPNVVPFNVTYNALQDQYLVMTKASHTFAGSGAVWDDTNKKMTTAVPGRFDMKTFLVYNDANNTKFGQISPSTEQARYSYVVSGAAEGMKNGEVVVVDNTDFTATNNYEAVIKARFIDSKTEHSITAKYAYYNVSYKKFEANKAYKTNGTAATTVNAGYYVNDYIATAAQEPKVTFMSWSKIGGQFTNYKTKFYEERAQSGSGSSFKSRIAYYANEIKWTTKGTTITKTGTDANMFDLTNVIYKLGLKSAVTDVPAGGTINDDLQDLITGGYLVLKDAYTEANGVKNAYFKPVFTYNGGISGFTQEAAKTVDHEENIVLVVVDCYGHEETIKLPIRIVSAYSNYTPVAAGSGITQGAGYGATENNW